MGKIQTLGIEELEHVSIKVSLRSSSNNNWKHKEINTLPSFNFDYDDNDARFVGKSNDLLKYRNAYWASEITPGTTHQLKYELELHDAVLEAIKNLNSKWEKSFANEISRDFK